MGSFAYVIPPGPRAALRDWVRADREDLLLPSRGKGKRGFKARPIDRLLASSWAANKNVIVMVFLAIF